MPDVVEDVVEGSAVLEGEHSLDAFLGRAFALALVVTSEKTLRSCVVDEVAVVVGVLEIVVVASLSVNRMETLPCTELVVARSYFDQDPGCTH